MPSRRAVAAVAAALALIGVSAAACRPREPPPNVILISADTLRADRLGAYGYDARPTSPRIDALAAEALLFEVHVAAAPWTTPSHLSLLTGLTPTRHGVTGSDRALREALRGDRTIQRLPEAVTTLAEALAARGWSTGAFTGGATLDPRIGFDQGFGEYDTSMVKLDRGKVDRVFEWIDAQEDAVLPLLAHLRGPRPLRGPPLPRRRAARGARARRSEIDSSTSPRREGGSRSATPSGRCGPTTPTPPRSPARSTTGASAPSTAGWGSSWTSSTNATSTSAPLLVLTSDHGEQLGEEGRPAPYGDGFYNVHGHTLFEELVRVPLIVRLPGQREGRRIGAVTASIDVLPTILDLLGLPSPPEVQGQSLRPLWESPGEWQPRAALSESLSEGEEMKGLRDGRHKLVVTIGAQTVEKQGRSHLPPHPPAALFDLVRDPGERRDLLEGRMEQEVTAQAMLEELRGRLSVAGTADTGTMSPEALEGLKALGYVE